MNKKNAEIKESIRDLALAMGFCEDRYGTCKITVGEKMFRFKFDNTSFRFDGKYKGYAGFGWNTLVNGYYTDTMVIGGNLIVGGRTVLSYDGLKKAGISHK